MSLMLASWVGTVGTWVWKGAVEYWMFVPFVQEGPL